MYAADSFFDLSPWGRVGLVAISLGLSVLAVAVSHAALRHRPALVCIAGALLLFWTFLWLSPQVYYSYYHLLFDGLPVQWVIWPPPPPVRTIEVLAFQYRPTLAAHGQAVLGWAMLAAPFLRRRTRALP